MAENVIPRKYNYTLETGPVGTDDDDMANILYNINRMEMKAAYDTDDLKDMQKAFGDAFFMALDSSMHFKSFLEKQDGKLNEGTIRSVKNTLDEAAAVLGAVKPPQTDIELMNTSIKTAYQKMLNAVPSLVLLDKQSI